VGDLGKAVGGKDGNGESEAIVGVVVGFGDGGREALAKLNETSEAKNTEVTGGVVVKEKDFGHGGVGWVGLVVASTGDFLKNLFNIGARHIGFGQPVQGEEKISLHPAWSTKLCANKGICEFAKIFHCGLCLFENVHAGGGGHRIEHQVVEASNCKTTEEVVLILKVGIKGKNRRRSRPNKGAIRKK